MATPQWVRFSSLARTPAEICRQDLADLFVAYGFRLWVISRLGRGGPRNEMADIDAPPVECADIDDALRLSAAWDGVAMHFIVDDVGYNIALNLWREEGRTVVCLYLQTGIVWYKEGGYEEGEWLRAFLLRFASSVGAQCCGFGRDDEYHFVYRPLNPASVLGRIADGSLFQIHDPAIHLVSVDLVDASEVRASLARHGSREGFRYASSTNGYHVLWNF